MQRLTVPPIWRPPCRRILPARYQIPRSISSPLAEIDLPATVWQASSNRGQPQSTAARHLRASDSTSGQLPFLPSILVESERELRREPGPGCHPPSGGRGADLLRI